MNVDDPRVRWPAKGRVFNRMEELIQQFKAVTEGPLVPAGEAYHAIESANGELGFYVVSDGTAQPWKVRCRPPSFINLQPMPDDAARRDARRPDPDLRLPQHDRRRVRSMSAKARWIGRAGPQVVRPAATSGSGLGAPTDQIGSVNDPRTHDEYGVSLEREVDLSRTAREVERVVLWNRYDLLGVFRVRPDGSADAESVTGSVSQPGPPPLRSLGLVLHRDGRFTHEGHADSQRRECARPSSAVCTSCPPRASTSCRLGHFRGQLDVEECGFFVRGVDLASGKHRALGRQPRIDSIRRRSRSRRSTPTCCSAP